MRDLIIYQSSYRTEVLGANRIGEPAHIQKLACANFVANLKTGQILKDRYTGRAGDYLDMDELRELRQRHCYTPPNKRHFEEELFKL
jgi:hypothetical protein